MQSSPQVEDRPDRPDRRELAMVALLVVAGGAWALAVTDQMWFTADFWGLIEAEPGGLPHLLEPHAGHLVVFHTASAILIAAVTDFGSAWPWALLPRVVAWGVLVSVLWWVTRRRGADPRVALAAAAVLSVYGGTGWLMGWFAGSPLAVAAVVLGAWLVAEVATPSSAERVALGALLLAAAASTSAGVLGVAAVVVVTIVSGRWRGWWPALAVAPLAYLGWRQFASPSSGSPPLDAEVLLDLPIASLQIVQHGYAGFLTLAPMWGWVAVAAVAGLLLWLAVRRRLDVFDATMLLWGAFFAGATVAVRIAAGSASVTTTRYGYLIVLATVALVLPRIRPGAGPAMTAAVLLVGVVLTGRNALLLQRGLEFWERRSLDSREVVESAAALLAAGEPALPEVSVDFPRAGKLTTTQLAKLVSAGWRPTIWGDEAVQTARGDLRVQANQAAAPMIATCRAVPNGTAVEEFADGTVVVPGPEGAAVVVRDEFGTARQELPRDHPPAYAVTVLDGAEVVLDGRGAPIVLCPLSIPWPGWPFPGGIAGH